MKKQLICIGGPMGVGKTTTCRQIQAQLDGCVFLDGDWCWDAHPFVNTRETRAMVMGNIRHLLDAFLGCSAYETVLFCWVFHQADILPSILSGLNHAYRLYTLSLVCSAPELTARLMGDVKAGLRQPEVIQRSLNRLPLYQALGWPMLDTGGYTPRQAADAALAMLREAGARV